MHSRMQFFILIFLSAIGISGRGEARASLNGFQDRGLRKEIAAVARFGLTRLRDQAHLKHFIDHGLLVRVPDNGSGFYLDTRIGGRADRNRHYYRYARAYTRRFIARLGEQYYTRSRDAFMVTSLVRTCRYQQRLQRDNMNAAACDETSHTTGATVDIQYLTMTAHGRTWVERVLLDLERRGFIQATKEPGQSVYHVMVYPPYMRYIPRE